MTWETFTRRTNDPKLAYIEHLLTLNSIPHRRNGESWHAPILEVPTGEFLNRAWELLSLPLSPVDARPLDDVPDDDPFFQEYNQ
jgi:hypothetical protein